MNPNYINEIEKTSEYNEDECVQTTPFKMSEEELNTIIRLIPHASPRQTLVIEGQIQIHKQLHKNNEKK